MCIRDRYSGDPNNGAYYIGTDNWGLVAGGTKVVDLTASGVGLVGAIGFGDGSASAPAIGFTSDTNTGFYRIGADNLGVSTGGALRWDFNSTFHDANALPILNVGNAGTDFDTDGGLVLANGLTITAKALTLNVGHTLISSSANTATWMLPAATGSVNVLTGNLKIGDGSPTVALDGEDGYIEGSLEVGGDSKLVGTVTASGDVDVNGVIHAYSNLYVAGKTVDGPVSLIPADGATIVPTATLYLLSPTGDVTITLGTSGIAAGTIVEYHNMVAQNIIFAYTNVRTSTGAALTIGQYDVVIWRFTGTEWHELLLIANS